MGGAVFLSYWLFGLWPPALEFAGSWIELGLGAEMRTSGRTRSSHHRSSGLTFQPGNQDPTSFVAQ